MKSICKGNRFKESPENLQRIQTLSGFSRNSIQFYFNQLIADNWAYRKRGLIYLRSTRKIASQLGFGGRVCFSIMEHDLKHSRLANAILRSVGEGLARSQKHYKSRITGNKNYFDSLVTNQNPIVRERQNIERSEDRFFATMCQQQQTDFAHHTREVSEQKSVTPLFVGDNSDYFGASYSLFGSILKRSKSTMHRRISQCVSDGTVMKQNVFRKESEIDKSFSLNQFAQKNPETYSHYRLLRVNDKPVLCEMMPNRYGFKDVLLVRSFERI